MRNVGMGIEGRPSASSPNVKGMRKSHGMSLSGHASSSSSSSSSSGTQRRQASSSSAFASMSLPRLSGPDPCSASGSGLGSDHAVDTSVEQASHARQERQLPTTLALLQTFHANTCFQLSRLANLLIPVPRVGVSLSGTRTTPPDVEVIYVTPKDVLSFELGPLSTLDARYLEWLAEEYGGGTRFVVKRGWKDLLGVLFGFS